MTDPADRHLLDVLSDFREPAMALLAHRERNPNSIDPARAPSWREMTDLVAAAMTKHPVFGQGREVFFIGRQLALWPWAQSNNLLRKTAQLNAEAAIRWYHKVLSTEVADVSVITEVHGLNIKEAVTFSNGVTLTNVSALKDTPQARSLAAQSFAVHNLLFPAAATIPRKGVEGTVDHDQSHQLFLGEVERIRRTITALSLSDKNNPTTGISWIDFDDPDLTAAEYGRVWQSATYDGRQSKYPIDLEAQAVAWVERFLSLEGDVTKSCDVALSRLNLARRRQTAGDKAIDGCISLEALLGDGQSGDLTYKLKLRAARLLGGTLEDRKRISSAVGAFYALRGKVVHGQSQGISTKDQETAAKGLEICLDLLHAVITSGNLPIISDLELGPAEKP